MKKANLILTFISICFAIFPLSGYSQNIQVTADQFLLEDRVIEHSAASNHVRVYGTEGRGGEYVAIIPSLGRGVEDYTEAYSSTLTTHLVAAGYRVVLIQPRGIGKSSGDLTPNLASMSMFAQDIKASFDAMGIEKVSLIGHAYGNRLARTFTTLFPSYVNDLVLMAAGGNFEMSEGQQKCLANQFNKTLNDKDRLEAIDCAFFAEGNDATVWLNGWYPKLANAQIMTTAMINGDFFKKAGGKPFLLIQPAEDFIAPPDKAGKVLKEELGAQVTYVEIPHTGHALSSERPDEVAAVIIDYLKR